MMPAGHTGKKNAHPWRSPPPSPCSAARPTA